MWVPFFNRVRIVAIAEGNGFVINKHIEHKELKGSQLIGHKPY